MYKQNRMVSLLLIIALLAGLFPVTIPVARAAVSFAGGNGTAQNPYQISTPEQLDAVRNNLSASYILMNDIDLANWGYWEPIGVFEGYFNGNNYKVKNMSIMYHPVGGLGETLGLFAYGMGCTVKNLIIENIYIEFFEPANKPGTPIIVYSNQSIGSIIGYAISSVIENCSSIGNITLSKGTCAGHIGGIVGYAYDSNIKNCSNSSSICGIDSFYVGGILGGAYRNVVIEGCYNTGDISAKYISGGVFGTLGGYESNLDEGYLTISNCYNTGNVLSDGNYMGGICGDVRRHSATVQNCYNTGTVSSSLASAYAGGIVGMFYESDAIIQNCISLNEYILATTTNISRVTATNVSNESVILLNNNKAWASMKLGKTKETAVIATTDIGHDKPNGESVSMQQLKQRSTYESMGWDFVNTWKMVEGCPLPQLKWQTTYTYPILPVDEGEFTEGIGSQSDPYLVRNVKQLDNVRNMPDKHFKQVADIDMSGVNDWEPIDNFSGSYDGQGYVIHNLKMRNTTTGLIGAVNQKGVLKNINMEEIYVDIYSNDNNIRVGTLAIASEGLIENCYIQCVMNIEGDLDVSVGGMVAINMGVIANSDVSCDIYIQGDILFCGSVAEINTGRIMNCSSRGSVFAVGTSNTNLGGLVCNNSGEITECYSVCDVEATGSDFSIGGLVANNYSTLINCYAINSVGGTTLKNAPFIGGLVGYGSNSQIEQCYFAGSFSIKSHNLGGLCGGGNPFFVTCYFNKDTTEVGAAVGYNGNAQGTFAALDEKQMYYQENFAGFDFNDIWKMEEGYGYPQLRWQTSFEGPSHYVERPITFIPVLPKDDSVTSEIMDGGTVVRHYNIIDTETGKPLANREIKYGFNGSDKLTSRTDSNGMVAISNGPIHISGTYNLRLYNAEGELRDDVTALPSFKIKVTPLKTTQEFELSRTLNGVLGLKAGVELTVSDVDIGDLNFASVAASGEISNTTRIKFKNEGDVTDVVIGNNAALKLGAAAQFGLFGSLFKDQPMELKIDANTSAGIAGGVGCGGEIVLKDFFNNKDPMYQVKAVYAATYLMESLLQGQSIQSVSMSSIMDVLFRYCYDTRIAEEHYKTLEATLALKKGYKVGFELPRLSGVGTVNGTLVSNEFDVTGKMSTKTPVWENADKLKQEHKVSVDTRVTQAKLRQEVTWDIYNDIKLFIPPQDSYGVQYSAKSVRTGNGFVDEVVLSHGLYNSGSIGLVKDANKSIINLSLKDLVLSKALSDNVALNSFALDRSRPMDASTLDNFWKYASEVSMAGYPDFSIENSKEILLDIPLKCKVSAAVTIGGGIRFVAKQSDLRTTYTGNFVDGEAFITGKYDPANGGAMHTLEDLFQTAFDSIYDVLTDYLITTANNIADGVDAAGAYFSGLWDNAVGYITQVVSGGPRVFAAAEYLSTTENRVTPLQIATSIGDCYIVNLKDASGHDVPGFSSNPLNLTINYSVQQLAAAGLSLSDEIDIKMYYYNDETGFYVPINCVVDTVAKKVSADVVKPGEYVIGIDTTKPSITELKRTVSIGSSAIRAVVTTDFTEIDSQSLILSIDGSVVVDSSNAVDYFDVATGVFYYPMPSLAEGNHTVLLAVSDKDGNVADAVYLTFFINETPPTVNVMSVYCADSILTVEVEVLANAAVESVSMGYMNNDGEYYSYAQGEKTDDNTYTLSGLIDMSKDVEYFIVVGDVTGNVTQTQNYSFLHGPLTEKPQLISHYLRTSGVAITQFTAGDIEYLVEIKNGTAYGITPVIILATYDVDGKMLDFVYTNGDIKTGERKILKAAINVSVRANSIKAMTWSSISELKPLGEAIYLKR